MDQLWPQLPDELQSSMPRALDLHRNGGITAMAAGVVTGNRLLVPGLTGDVPPRARDIMDSFFRRSFRFARALAEATSSPSPRDSGPLADIAGEFARRFLADQPDFRSRVQDFAHAIQATTIAWHPAWQHQDVAVGNVLEDGEDLRFVDWEHAGGDCVPWFDIAFAPVVTSHLAGGGSIASHRWRPPLSVCWAGKPQSAPSLRERMRRRSGTIPCPSRGGSR